MDTVITPFDPIRATDSEMAEHHKIALAVRRTDYPRLPEHTVDYHNTLMRAASSGLGSRRFWVARHEGRIVGSAVLGLPGSENSRTAITQVRVLPQMRRRGIGTALLRETLPDCRADGRETVLAYDIRADGEGEAWVSSLGFARVAERVRQTLSIRDTDPAAWQVQPPEGFRTMRWTATAPQEVVAGYARARNAMQDAPDLGLAMPVWTVERVRRYEADAVERDSVLHTAVVVHEATGAVVALTETETHATQDDLVLQQDTVVLPEFRGRGLGRVVKAAMMRGLTAEHPGATHIITNTATSNHYMIRVNQQIGYTTDHVLATLEIGLDPLQRRIG